MASSVGHVAWVPPERVSCLDRRREAPVAQIELGVARRILALQRAAGNRAVARAVVKPSASIPGVSVRKLQRVIGFGPLGGVPGVIVPPAAGAVLPGGFGFYRIMGGVPLVIRRPAWTGRWSATPPGGWPAGQSRNHVIPYQLIGEALTNVSQALYAAAHGVNTAGPGGLGAAMAARAAAGQALIDITESLFPNGPGGPGAPIPEHGIMHARRNAFVNYIDNLPNHAGPTAAQQNQLARLATRLESSLMSSPENVRLGNANMNTRIGSGIDPALGPMVATPAGPAPGAPAYLPAGLVSPAAWGAPATFGRTFDPGVPALAPGAQFYTMAPAANSIVYRFITAAVHYVANPIAIIRNTAPLVPGYPINAPLSSTALPAGAANQPLLVFDPAGAALPYRFG